MDKGIKNHKDLKVWQISVELVTETYLFVKTFPADERYCLGQQMRRAAISVPSNISEGAGRRSNKEFIYFLYISMGSLTELETQFHIAENLGYLFKLEKTYSKILSLKIMINGLIRKLQSLNSEY